LAETAGNWFENLLSPSTQAPAEAENAQSVKQQQPPRIEAKEELDHRGLPKPYMAPMTPPWERLLKNVKELFPEMYRAMQIIQQLGATIIQGEHQFFLGRGAFLTERDFEILVSGLYYHIILHKTTGTKMYDVFNELRIRGVRLKDTGNGLRLVKSEYINNEDWERIKKEMLEPNRDEVLRLQRLAREEVSFILSLSRMAEVIPHGSGVEWDELGK